jgi:choline dehydrogenase
VTSYDVVVVGAGSAGCVLAARVRAALAGDDAELDELALAEHVVDTACRVLGVEGLAVVDASVVPRVPRPGTNLAAMAVAERFAAAR